MRKAVSPQAPTDMLGELYESPLGDMTGARNDHKPKVLTDLPICSTSVVILAIEAIIIMA
jgi:hypothetical protein